MFLAIFSPVVLTLEASEMAAIFQVHNQNILRWLDIVFQGQYLPSLSINYVAKIEVLEKLPPQLY